MGTATRPAELLKPGHAPERRDCAVNRSPGRSRTVSWPARANPRRADSARLTAPALVPVSAEESAPIDAFRAGRRAFPGFKPCYGVLRGVFSGLGRGWMMPVAIAPGDAKTTRAFDLDPLAHPPSTRSGRSGRGG